MKAPGRELNERQFPISRDPPEGGTSFAAHAVNTLGISFPISRDPPEGGTGMTIKVYSVVQRFQFLGIPPKGEHYSSYSYTKVADL